MRDPHAMPETAALLGRAWAWVKTHYGPAGFLLALVVVITGGINHLLSGGKKPDVSVGAVLGDSAIITSGDVRVRNDIKPLVERYESVVRDNESLKQQLELAEERLQERAEAGDEDAKKAREALERGDTALAEALFAALAAKTESAGDAEHKEAAENYRSLGALAFLHDTEKALSAYRDATRLDPDEPSGWNQLGHLLLRAGELDGATRAYARAGEVGSTRDWEVISLGKLGNIYLTHGDLDKAEEHNKRALAINFELGRLEGMAASLGSLGLIYHARGELDKAEEHQNCSLNINTVLLGSKEGMSRSPYPVPIATLARARNHADPGDRRRDA